MNLKDYVKEIPDYPKKGILFRDVTGILEDAQGFKFALDMMEEALKGEEIDLVAAPEARGFIFGAALADRLRTAFVPVRKPGKLPRATVSETYNLEYGTATLHIHADAIKPGQKVVLLDDLLATGGTALAAAHLIEKLGGKVVRMIFPLELMGFNARNTTLAGYKITALVQYEGK